MIDLILPVLDERDALPVVLGALPAGVRAIVVDNGSTDGSPQIAAGLGAQVVSESRRGYGAACHAGLLAATADTVAFMDADASFDPADVLRVGELLDDGADLGLGSRRPTVKGAWPVHARIANRVLAAEIRRRSGVRLTDIGPLRVARREPLLALGVQDRRSGYPLETVLRAAASGWTIAELPVAYHPRVGRSKVTGTVGGTLRAVRDMAGALT